MPDSIDLTKFRITNSKEERTAVIDILAKIKGWIKQNSPEAEKDANNSILLNKITYFSALELGLDITRGWYIYGPCIDFYINPESSRLAYIETKPAKNIESQITRECAFHIPSFMDHRREQDFYGYLDNVYRNKSDEFSPVLKNLYISKNQLFWRLHELSEGQTVDENLIISAFDYFNQSFTDEEYKLFTGMDDSAFDNFLDYSFSVMDAILQISPELHKREKKRNIQHEIHEISQSFNRTLFKSLSDKNYSATLKSFSDEIIRFKRDHARRLYLTDVKETQREKDRLQYMLFSKGFA